MRAPTSRSPESVRSPDLVSCLASVTSAVDIDHDGIDTLDDGRPWFREPSADAAATLAGTPTDTGRPRTEQGRASS
ncbi:hypothetical protein [Streptomyces gardneri]|uniref:hypothetical protein n=1 Tax=Streptomyces gardneri TaxID=66892 RepID=UPI0037CEBF30